MAISKATLIVVVAEVVEAAADADVVAEVAQAADRVHKRLQIVVEIAAVEAAAVLIAVIRPTAVQVMIAAETETIAAAEAAADADDAKT